MATPPDDMNPRTRIKFDGTISAGNVLTAITLIVVVIVWGTRLEGRVDQNSARIEQMEVTSVRQMAAVMTEMQQMETRIRSDVAELRAVLLRSPGANGMPSGPEMPR